jgi:hypothetical protein
MRCKRVGTLTVDEEVFDVLGVALHPRLHMLLGVADIPFVRLKTLCLVYHYRMVAFAFIRAHLFVSAVAREVLEVL